MEHGPLPPHERTWRHPSELAAEQHATLRAETATASTRRFAVTTGSLGLLAVGLLFFAVTPRATDAPIAVSVTTTPDAGASTAALQRSNPGTAALAAGSRPLLGMRSPVPPLATPIGDGQYALVSAADIPNAVGAHLEVRLPSGGVGDAEVTARDGDAVLVELSEREPGLELAEHRPMGHEVVTVLAQPPITIVLDDLALIDVEAVTAVLDDDGALVGLCSQRGGGDAVYLVDVSEAAAGASADDPDTD